MSSIIHRKRNGTTYVYEVNSAWDSYKKQSRSEQVLLGKLDPHTGDIIPTLTQAHFDQALEEIRLLKEENKRLKEEIASLKKSIDERT